MIIENESSSYDSERGTKQINEMKIHNCRCSNDIHRMYEKRKIDRILRRVSEASPGEEKRTGRLDTIFSSLIGDVELSRILKRKYPKVHNRIEGKLIAAKRELSRLIRREERISFLRLLEHHRLDPEGPYPTALADKYGRGYGLRN